MTNFYEDGGLFSPLYAKNKGTREVDDIRARRARAVISVGTSTTLLYTTSTAAE